jgi:KipI family sensor histidine kinase inhibitor
VSVARPFGEAAFIVETADATAAERLRLSLTALPIPGVRAAVPGRASVLVEFDPLVIDAHDLARALADARGVDQLPPSTQRLRRIPVVYGGQYGPDLDSVADSAGLAAADVIELHAATELRVLFCGFAPGFAYLGDVPEPLVVARLATPRAVTPAGSVALADGMSGVYPANLPGGWRVIGRTPRRMFDPRRSPPAYLAPGDVIRFDPIRSEDWHAHPEVAPDW